MANYSSPWDAYWSLMTCWLVVLDKHQGGCTVLIREMFLWYLAKLLLRVDGDQSKTSCVNLQICFIIKASIGGSTHAVGRWWQ